MTSLSLWSVNMNRLWHCKQQRGVRWTAGNSVAAVSRAEQRSTLSSFRRSRMAGDLGLKIIPPLSKRNAARSHSSLFYKRKINSTFELELWSHKAGHKHITDGQRKSNWHEIITALNLFCELLLLLTFSSHYKQRRRAPRSQTHIIKVKFKTVTCKVHPQVKKESYATLNVLFFFFIHKS